MEKATVTNVFITQEQGNYGIWFEKEDGNSVYVDFQNDKVRVSYNGNLNNCWEIPKTDFDLECGIDITNFKK